MSNKPCKYCEVNCGNSWCFTNQKRNYLLASLLILLSSCGLIRRYDYIISLPNGEWKCTNTQVFDDQVFENCKNLQTNQKAVSISANNTAIIKIRRKYD